MGSRRLNGPREASSPERRFGRWALVTVGVIVLAFVVIRASSRSKHEVSAAPAAAESSPRALLARAANPPARVPAKTAAAEPPLGPNPASLQGTEEDGALRVDDRGDLLVGPEILAFFDYYLAATGEE